MAKSKKTTTSKTIKKAANKAGFTKFEVFNVGVPKKYGKTLI